MVKISISLTLHNRPRILHEAVNPGQESLRLIRVLEHPLLEHPQSSQPLIKADSGLKGYDKGQKPVQATDFQLDTDGF